MKPSSPPKVLCVIGTGVQARSHIEALRIVQDFDEVITLLIFYSDVVCMKC